MITYLDTSVLVALLTIDALTPRADAFFRTQRPSPMVSDFAAAEFASAVSRRVRTAELTLSEASEGLANLDHWMRTATARTLATSADIAAADRMLRRLDLPLRTPDALNIAICRRVGAALATFDEKMRACAVALGVNVAAAA